MKRHICAGKRSGDKPEEGSRQVTSAATAQHSRVSAQQHSAGTGSAGVVCSILTVSTNLPGNRAKSSAPMIRAPHNSGERVPSSDAAPIGAETNPRARSQAAKAPAFDAVTAGSNPAALANECPVCAERRRKKALAQKSWRKGRRKAEQKTT